MPNFTVECAKRDTGEVYHITCQGRTPSDAMQRALDTGHIASRVVPDRPAALPPAAVDPGQAALLDEVRQLRQSQQALLAADRARLSAQRSASAWTIVGRIFAWLAIASLVCGISALFYHPNRSHAGELEFAQGLFFWGVVGFFVFVFAYVVIRIFAPVIGAAVRSPATPVAPLRAPGRR